MSKITDAYEELKTDMAALYPDKVRLANPFVIDSNTVESKNNGWAIRIGPGQNTERQLACKMSIERLMTIIITKKITAGELRPEDIDTVYKDILEEHFALISKYEIEPDLKTSSVFKFVYFNDNGIENLIENEGKWVKIESVFKMEYFENLN